MRLWASGVPTYSIGQAARLLRVSPETVRRWADAGRLPMGRDGSGNRVIDGVGLAGFAKERAAEDARCVVEGPPTSRSLLQRDHVAYSNRPRFENVQVHTQA